MFWEVPSNTDLRFLVLVNLSIRTDLQILQAKAKVTKIGRDFRQISSCLTPTSKHKLIQSTWHITWAVKIPRVSCWGVGACRFWPVAQENNGLSCDCTASIWEIRSICNDVTWAGTSWTSLFYCTTVDRRNPAPVDMINIPLFTWFYTSQVVVWDFSPSMNRTIQRSIKKHQPKNKRNRYNYPIITQLAIYKWYISGIYCQLGDYISPSTC